MATGAIGSSNADRGNAADVGDICGDLRRKYVEIGVVACKSASCDHVSLSRGDTLPLGEVFEPRVALERGEGSGEVEGAYRAISVKVMETISGGAYPLRFPCLKQCWATSFPRNLQ
jgi:hypothetical protein